MADTKLIGFRQQAGSLGYETDDFLLFCEQEQQLRKALMQVKHSIVITDGQSIFSEVVVAAWKDFRNAELFNPITDKIFLISASFPVSVKQHLVTLLGWAKVKNSEADFTNEVRRIAAKKKYYDYFYNIVSSIEPSVTAQDLYTFFRCYEVMDLDLDQPTSVTKANMLTLVDLAKTDYTVKAVEIWNSIYEMLSDSNAKGGNYSIHTVPERIRKWFNLGYYAPAHWKLQQLSRKSLLTVEVIRDSIGNFVLDRSALLEAALEKLDQVQILLLTGDAGTGKSAMAKAIIAHLQNCYGGYALAMKADELLTGQLHDRFEAAGFHQDLKSIFSHFALLRYSIIYVDALEKLLEDYAVAFSQLIVILQQAPAIKLVVSCRKNLVGLLVRKFFINSTFEEMEVPYLKDEELTTIAQAVPALRPAIENPELRQLIRIPKYLDFAYAALSMVGTDYGVISEIGFQDQLWDAIVANIYDGNKDGLPVKRAAAFIGIVETRCRKMQGYVTPPYPDVVALEKLEKDNVIYQYEQKGMYAPAHDVLGDWALVRFADQLFAKK